MDVTKPRPNVLNRGKLQPLKLRTKVTNEIQKSEPKKQEDSYPYNSILNSTHYGDGLSVPGKLPSLIRKSSTNVKRQVTFKESNSVIDSSNDTFDIPLPPVMEEQRR